jgi:hypothetical protein
VLIDPELRRVVLAELRSQPIQRLVAVGEPHPPGLPIGGGTPGMSPFPEAQGGATLSTDESPGHPAADEATRSVKTGSLRWWVAVLSLSAVVIAAVLGGVHVAELIL